MGLDPQCAAGDRNDQELHHEPIISLWLSGPGKDRHEHTTDRRA
jgi:hypothetical protein